MSTNYMTTSLQVDSLMATSVDVDHRLQCNELLSDNATIGNLNVGNLTLSNITANVITGTRLELGTGNITAGNLNVGNVNANVITGTRLELGTGNITAGNVVSSRLISTNGIVANDTWLVVTNLSDLPNPVASVITVPDSYTLFITRRIDLNGNRLSCLGNTSIIGTNPYSSALFSTGLSSGSSLITTTIGNLSIQNMTLGCPTGTRVLNVTGSSSAALLLNNIEFGYDSITCTSVGNVSVSTYASSIRMRNTINGIRFLNTVPRIELNNCIFDSPVLTSTYVTLSSTLTVTDYIRCTTSKIVLPSATTGFDYESGVTIPSSGFILRDIRFSGLGTDFVKGITSTSNVALFSSLSSPVTNTYELGGMYLINNTTQTTFSLSNSFVKGVGTYTSDTDNRKFSVIGNALVYTGSVSKTFSVRATCTVVGSNKKIIALRFYKTGNAIINSEQQQTLSSADEPYNMSIRAMTTLSAGDNVEVWVANLSSTQHIHLSYVAVHITPIYAL